MESIWIPPTSSTKRVSRRSVSASARGRARCCRSRTSARTAASEAIGCFTASVTARDLPIGQGDDGVEARLIADDAGDVATARQVLGQDDVARTDSRDGAVTDLDLGLARQRDRVLPPRRAVPVEDVARGDTRKAMPSADCIAVASP